MKLYDFILSEKSNLYMVVKLSIVFNTPPTRLLSTFSIDKILLPSYVNWFTNLRGFSFNEVMAQNLESDGKKVGI